MISVASTSSLIAIAAAGEDKADNAINIAVADITNGEKAFLVGIGS